MIEVWESQEAATRSFQESLGQALQTANISVQPQVFPIHNMLRA